MAHVKNCHVGTSCSKHDYNLSCCFGLQISSDRFVLNVQKTDWGNISKVIITLDIWGGPFKHILFIYSVRSRSSFIFLSDPLVHWCHWINLRSVRKNYYCSQFYLLDYGILLAQLSVDVNGALPIRQVRRIL